MAGEKKQSFVAGAAILSASTLLVKILGLLFSIRWPMSSTTGPCPTSTRPTTSSGCSWCSPPPGCRWRSPAWWAPPMPRAAKKRRTGCSPWPSAVLHHRPPGVPGHVLRGGAHRGILRQTLGRIRPSWPWPPPCSSSPSCPPCGGTSRAAATWCPPPSPRSRGHHESVHRCGPGRLHHLPLPGRRLGRRGGHHRRVHQRRAGHPVPGVLQAAAKPPGQKAPCR